MKNKKFVVAVSGSSGSAYARILLSRLKEFNDVEWGIVFSQNAIVNWEKENPGIRWDQFPYRYYSTQDFNAPFASGSANWDGMIVCPCSAGFLAKAACGLADDLMSRAAQVMLKERKRLILVLRETPLSLIHIEHMKILTLAGAVICPAIPSFYSQASSTDEILSTVVNRVLDLCGLDSKSYRWGN